MESGDEWERQFEGREVPEEYRIMSYPQPERGEQDKAYMDAAETQQADAQADSSERLSSTPWRPYISDCRYSGVCSAYFELSTRASSPGPAIPRSMGREGAGACTMASH